MFLTASELEELTHRKYPAWQARELTKLGIPFRRRTDGTLVVLRDDCRTEQDSRPKRSPQLRFG